MEYHATVMQRPVNGKGDEETGLTRDGASNSNNNHHGGSPTSEYHPPPFSPTNTNGHRPHQFNAYHPPTPASLPLPPHVAGVPASPRSLVHQSPYSTPSEYQSANRPSGPPTFPEFQSTPSTQRAYYDPTSDSTPTHAAYTPPSNIVSHSHPSISQSPRMASASSPVGRTNGVSIKQEPQPPASVRSNIHFYHLC
jgi:hypothetical protein